MVSGSKYGIGMLYWAQVGVILPLSLSQLGSGYGYIVGWGYINQFSIFFTITWNRSFRFLFFPIEESVLQYIYKYRREILRNIYIWIYWINEWSIITLLQRTIPICRWDFIIIATYRKGYYWTLTLGQVLYRCYAHHKSDSTLDYL